jgi:hypothetical protein
MWTRVRSQLSFVVILALVTGVVVRPGTILMLILGGVVSVIAALRALFYDRKQGSKLRIVYLDPSAGMSAGTANAMQHKHETSVSIMLEWLFRRRKQPPKTIASIRFSFGRKQQRSQRIVRPPLGAFDAIAKFFYSKKVYERVFQPLRAEIIFEWQEAEVEKRVWRARYIKWVRGPYAVIGHVGAQLVVTIVKKAISMFKTG